MDGWNRYWINSLTQPELKSLVMRDVKYETEWVKEITRIACDNCPKLSKQQIKNQEILEEDIEF